MVARKPGAESIALNPLTRAFHWWRTWLSRRAWAVVESVRPLRQRFGSRVTPHGVIVAAGEASGAVRPPARTATWLITAIVALLLGGIARISLAQGGSPRFEALSAAGFSWMLAAVRLYVLTVALARSGATRSALDAWARGSVVWAIAADAPLATVAWAVSAFVTGRTLINRGVSATRAYRAVAVAWGAHLLAVIGAWLLTNVWVAILAS